MSYAGVAASLEMTEPACRKLVSRAKARIGDDRVRHRPTRERQKELLSAFQNAIRTGEPGKLAAMLASDVRLIADGGGKVPAVTDVLEGTAVLAFLTDRLSDWWAAYEWGDVELNGSPSLVLRQNGEVVATVSLAFDRSDNVTHIFIVRNPDKLADLGEVSIH